MMQLVVMLIPVGEDIGEETHTDVDQFIRVESGEGRAELDGMTYHLTDGFCVIIPAGTKHNIINDSETDPLKLYTIYTPPEHLDKTVHQTKQDAAADTSDHFDGTISP